MNKNKKYNHKNKNSHKIIMIKDSYKVYKIYRLIKKKKNKSHNKLTSNKNNKQSIM